MINGNYTETHKIKKTVHYTETKKFFFQIGLFQNVTD